MRVIGTFSSSKRVAFNLGVTPVKRYHILQRLITQGNHIKIVEIGTFSGDTAKYLLDHCSGIWLSCVDPYKGYTAYDTTMMQQQRAYVTSEIFNKYVNVRHIDKPSVDAAKDFKPGSVDLVFIDGDHCYSAVLADLEAWYPIVRSGGIVSGHDYVEGPGLGVVQAVDAFCSRHSINNLKSTSDRFWFFEK